MREKKTFKKQNKRKTLSPEPYKLNLHNSKLFLINKFKHIEAKFPEAQIGLLLGGGQFILL